MKKLIQYLNLQSAPAFVLLLISTFTILLINILNINIYITIFIALITLILGIITIKKNKTKSFILISISIGLSFFINNHTIFNNTLPNKIIPSENAMVVGKIEKIIKQDELKTRYLISGNINTKSLQRIENNNFILNVYGNKKFNIGDKIISKCNIRLARNKILPTDFNERQYCKSLGTKWIANTSNENIILTEKSNFLYSIKNYTYNKILNKINSIFTPTTASISAALILADRSNMTTEIKEIFSITGIAHILALSGFHIGIIASIIYLLLSFISNRPLLKVIIFTISISSFIFLVGAPESAVRAGLMAILFVVGKTLQRNANALNIISIVIIITILIKPDFIYSISFQLSSISVLSIFLFFQIVKQCLETICHKKSKIINAVSLTISASIISAPVVAYYFGFFSIISPITNLLIIPIMSFGLINIIITLILSFIPFLAEIYSGTVEFIFTICINLIKFISEFNLIAIKGKAIFIPTLILSIFLIYIFTSKKSKQFIFRLSVIIIFSIELLFILKNNNLYNSNYNTEVKLFAKPNYSLLSIPLNSNNKNNLNELFLCIFDRKPAQYYFNDISLKEFIQENNVKYIGTTGIFSIEFTKDIKNIIEEKNIQIKNLDFYEQRFLEKKFLNGKYAAQIITNK